jgi:hypothetical protein
VGHNLCVIYAPGVYKGANIFKIKFHDTYDATERLKDDNMFQGLLQEIVGLLKEELSQEAILSPKWVRSEARNFFSSD